MSSHILCCVLGFIAGFVLAVILAGDMQLETKYVVIQQRDLIFEGR